MIHFTLMEVNLTSLLMTQFTPWEGLMFYELTGYQGCVWGIPDSEFGATTRIVFMEYKSDKI